MIDPRINISYALGFHHFLLDFINWGSWVQGGEVVVQLLVCPSKSGLSRKRKYGKIELRQGTVLKD